MKYLEATEFDPGVGAEFNILRYPHNGLFYNSRDNSLAVVAEVLGAPATTSTLYRDPALLDFLLDTQPNPEGK